MKEHILKGWTFQRGAYFILGMVLIISSLIDLFWVGILFGAYFAAMGLFAFGCPSGNCSSAPDLPDSRALREK